MEEFKPKLYISFPKRFQEYTKERVREICSEIAEKVFKDNELVFTAFMMVDCCKFIEIYDENSIQYLIDRLEYMEKSSIVCFMEDYKEDKICSIEYNIASKYDKNIIIFYRDMEE